MSFRPKTMLRNNQAHAQAQTVKHQPKPAPKRIFFAGVVHGGRRGGRS